MYAVVRSYHFDPSASEEISQKVQNGYVPLLKQAKGFIAYYWIDSSAGTGSAVAVFESKDGAEESTRLAAEYVQANMAHLLIKKPEILEGNVRANG
jgi:hypothetical protein